MSAHRVRNLAFLTATALLVACNACNKNEAWPGPKAEGSGKPIASGSSGTLRTAGRTPGPHPRILLTPQRLASISGLRAANAPAWTALLEDCTKAVAETIDAGYEAWDWGHATLNLAICYRVTKKQEFATAALKYFNALLDDRYKVGDKAGGDLVVRHDDGYGIRSHGWLGAIAYDWLSGFPLFDDALKKKTVDRMMAWTSWFNEKGYNHDEPIANYFAGFFGAVAFGGLAFEGEDPRAAELRKMGEKMWNQKIVPVYREKLAGGDFPEGWQYGDLVGALFAIYAEAENTAHVSSEPQKPLFDELPWIRETVAYHTHALWPDGKHVYDTGDWSTKPALGPPHTLMAVSTILPASDPAAKGAAFLARLARDVPAEEWKWLQVIAEDPSRPSEDPRKGPTSYLAKGTATMMARTDWSPSAIWVALSSASTLSDHQHLDAGHFEIVRGSDALVIDAAGYGAFSSMSHNTILVGAEKKWSTYAPNQGTWSYAASIARFEDAGPFVYALADYSSAYNPSGYPTQNPRRAVSRAEREMVFSRAPVAGMPGSARVILYDRMTVANPNWPTTWVVHGGPAPQLSGPAARFTQGRSSATITTILPMNVTGKLVDETNNKEAERPFFSNFPPEVTDEQGNAKPMKSVRLEIAIPSGPLERRFLHAVVVGPSEGPGTDKALRERATPVRLDGELADGVAIDGEAYVFPWIGPHVAPGQFWYKAPIGVTRHLLVGLAPGGKYRVTAAKEGSLCKLAVGGGGERAASAEGTMTLAVSDCQVR